MNEMQDVNAFLEHFGVKGMKWGVRKRQVRVSGDYKSTAGYRNRKAHELTNKQLRDVTNRLNLEMNYARLNRGRITSGHAKAKEILALATTAAAFYTLTQSPAGKALMNRGQQAAMKIAQLAVKHYPIR